MVNNEEFSKRLQKILEHYHLSASAFADSIEVQRSSISHILSGRNKPSLDFVLKVIQAYSDVDLYWLLNGKGNFPPAATPSISNEQETEKKADPSNTNKVANDVSSDLFSAPTEAHAKQEETPKPNTNAVATPNIPNRPPAFVKKVERIVIFYEDKTFETYTPNT